MTVKDAVDQWITVATMQWFSFQAPQQPKNATKKVKRPTTMRIMGPAEALTSMIRKVLCIETCTTTPTTISASPQNCKNRRLV